MADVISALYRKRADLLNRKKTIQLEAEIRMTQADNELKDIDRAIATLNNAVKEYLCPQCKGIGEIRKPDAAGQMEDWPCPQCKGTGVRSDDDG